MPTTSHILLAFFAVFLASSECKVELDGYVLAAHGSSRSLYEGGTTNWNVTIPFKAYLPLWAFGPVNAGGIAIREDDGHMFVPVHGDTPLNLQDTLQGGSSEKIWSPAYILELDSDSGKTLRVFNLSDIQGVDPVDCFESWIKFTSDGYPYFTGYRYNKQTKQSSWVFMILDRDDPTKSVYTLDQDLAPQIPNLSAKSTPQQIFWALTGPNGGVDAGVNLDGGHNVIGQFKTTATSTVLFNAFGNLTINNHLNDDSYGLTGIHIIELPLTESSTHKLVVRGCNTAPWIMVADTRGNYYLQCNKFDSAEQYFGAWDQFGRSLWNLTQKHDSYWDVIFMSDDESVLVGAWFDDQGWVAYDPLSGDRMWQVSNTDLPGVTSCVNTNTPFPPRIPIALKNSYMAIQCIRDNLPVIFFIELSSGKISENEITLRQTPMELMADGANNLYSVYELAGFVHVDRFQIGQL